MKRVFLSLMVMTTATTIVKASPVTCNNLKTMYQDSICCDNPTEEINCTHTLSINSDSTELSLEGGVLTLDLGTTIAATAANTAALNGGFGSITTGTCASHGYGVITSTAECEAAAVALGWSDVDVSGSTGSWSFRPPGCSQYSDGQLLYNTLTTSTTSCSSSYKCACQKSLVAATADNSVAITANSAAVAANTAALNGFVSITTGTCASHGYGVITTAAECEAAAVALGLSDLDVGGSKGSWTPYAPGCYLYDGGHLCYNTLTTSTVSCSSNFNCACQTPSLVAANSAALNDGGFGIDTGTCASHGYGVITSTAECEAAAVALGFSDVVVDSGYTFSWSDRPPGCYLLLVVPCSTIHSQPPPFHAAAISIAPVKKAWSPPPPIIPPLSPPIPPP